MSAPPIGVYGRLALATMRQSRVTLAILGFVTLIAAFLATRLDVDSDILSLMPAEEPTTVALKRLDEEEGGINVLTIAVEGPDEARREAFLDDLGGRLRALPEVEYVLWKLEPDDAFRIGMLQVPVADLRALRDRLNAALAFGPAVQNPLIAAQIFDLGPLSERLANAGSSVRFTTAEGVSRVIVRPRGSAHDIPFARKFMERVEDTLAAVDPGKAGVTIRWVGGAYRHNVEDYEGIRQDVLWPSAIATLAVLAILALAYRSARALGILFLPIVLANVWTLAFAAVSVGTLNTFTSFTNAVLIGIGVEFSVHVYARYREERGAGLGVEEAVIRAWDLVGGACTSACLTAAGGFFALVMAHFAGFRQLGWFLALGLILTLIAVLVATPVLIALLDRTPAEPHAAHKRVHHGHRKHPPSYRLAPMALLLAVSVTLVSAVLVRRVEFEYDLSELRRSGLAYADLTPQEQALARDSYAPLVATFPDEASLTAAYERIRAEVESKDLPEIARVLSVRTLIPADQDERIALLREIAATGENPNFAYLPAPIQKNIARLRERPLDRVTAEDLPAPVQHILGAQGGKHRLMLIPAGNMWDMREAEQLANAVARELPGVEIAGEYLTLGVLYRVMKSDAPVIAGVAFGLVCLFTALDLRRAVPTLGAIAVLLAGMAWWGALLVLSDIRISMVNFVGVPIVLGIGIDVMIHLIHRLEQEGPGKILKSLATTGYASALGTVTTVVAFAALSFATSQGVRSLGLLVLLGEIAVTLGGLVLVPLGFATRWRFVRRDE